MNFDELLDQVLALVQRQGRVSYRAIKRRFDVDDDYLTDLREEILFTHPHIREEEGRGLVWTAAPAPTGGLLPPPPLPNVALPQRASSSVVPHPSDAERRQLTVLFCDLVDSTVLASQLDPEDLREVARAYQEVCAKVVARFEGHIAQYLGDGLLVYFGYPQAHEDDAQRAVRAGLGIIEALRQLNTRLEQERGVHLATRLGIHTGLVVVGEVGGGTRQEQLALGETPNVAARLQGLAAPDTLVISAATFQLLGGFFACQPLGTPLLKGLPQPLAVYRVLYESMARSRLEAAGSAGWTPFVGREQELGVLRECWAQVKEGVGQVVLLSGEAGIGKSRLVQVLQDQVAAEPQAWLTPCQCSPYYQNTPLYPWIELLERVMLRFEREETPEQKLRKLEGFLVQYGLPLAEAMPLFAALLSLTLPTAYLPLPLAPEQQKQQILRTLLTILLRIAAQQPILFVMEDLHWVDASTLEFLSLLIAQGPTTRILVLCTFRPDFSPPWTGRSHLTQVTLHRFMRPQAAEMIRQVAHGKALPPEVVEQIVAKTDGVPLFVEELTKMVLESGLLQEREEGYALTGSLPALAIPATLHDSLMARLDRLGTVKGLAQLGATLGREFAYALLRTVSPWDEETLHQGLHQLVEAEFLYQRGLPPQATYLFKHALIQEAAYESLLKSTRQQYHQRIAQMLEAQFPATVETQPELVAQHYTAAGLPAQAVPYWQRAGEHAIARLAYVEATYHFTTGLEVLGALPETPQRISDELTLQIALGRALMAFKGYGAPEARHAYDRARHLCQQVRETPRLFSVLRGLAAFYYIRAEYQTAQVLGEQCLTLAQQTGDPALLFRAHLTLGIPLFWRGEFAAARGHLEEGLACFPVPQQRLRASRAVQDPGVTCLAFGGLNLWCLGYPDQAQQWHHQACSRAQELAHPFSVAESLAPALELWMRAVHSVRQQAEAMISLATEHDFSHWRSHAMIYRGWALAMQGQGEEGLALLHQGLDAWRAMGGELARTFFLALLAEGYGAVGQVVAGLAALNEALTLQDTNGERLYTAELHRLQGELLIQQTAPDKQLAEAWFWQALDVARRQQAKAWELRAAMSLARLWQQQGKRAEAHVLLAPIYGWFTEGFDTADLQEAKALLEELSQ